VSAEQAREGVADGTYYLSLTMPADFSRRIASSSGGSPETSALQVVTNDANNYIVGQISRTVFSEVRTAASAKASRSFLDRIFISFSGIHDATEKAAEGADKLKGGVSTAKEGSADLAAGLKDAKAGSGELAGGVKKLDKGAGELEKGSRQLAAGTQALADKVNGAAGSLSPYLKDNGATIADTARLVADSSGAMRGNLDNLVKGAPLAATAAHEASTDLAGVYRTRCEESDEPDPAACPPLERARTGLGDQRNSH
jgi:putative membrane protein